MRTLRRRYLRRSGPFKPSTPSTKVLCWEPGGGGRCCEGRRASTFRGADLQRYLQRDLRRYFKGTFERDLQRYLLRPRPFEGSLEGRDPSKVPSKRTFKGTFKGPDPSKVAWKVATLRRYLRRSVPMCKVCTEAVHAVALRTRATLGLDMCEVCTEPKQSIP